MGAEQFVLGVDVGGTKVAVAAVPAEGGPVAPDAELEGVERPTDTGSTEALLDGIDAAIRELTDRVGDPLAIGIGVPSQVDFATGTALSSVNIPLAGVPMRQELESRFGMPVFVDNDANCAALGEAQAIAHGGKPVENLVMLTLGTGVGGGVVIGGRIFRGATGAGVELGHFSLDPNGPPCPGNCPNHGCIEAFVSGRALERDATELGKGLPDSALGKLYAERGTVRAAEAVAAARDGDRDARVLFDRYGMLLGVAIAGYVNVFEPQHVVIGGGISRSADLFIERAREEVRNRAIPVILERVQISLARSGPGAGMIGAGVLALQESRASVDTALTEPGN